MRSSKVFFAVSFGLLVASCSGGGGSGSDGEGDDASNIGCDGSCAHQYLSSQDVTQILSQAISQTSALESAATIAVLDRVGNVLAVYQMPGALPTTRIDGQIGAQGGLEGVSVPSSLAAISKAGTGAFLSSQGNAFSTRTASQIIQENFNPGENNQPGGPLFGVQFSQLLCSDVTVRNSDVAAALPAGTKISRGGSLGPRALPLGLSADPGGIPLYKQGDVVGGIGIEINGTYTLDRDISNYDDDIEERVALAASRGFEAPSERLASKVFAGGKSLRYTDLRYEDLDVPAEQVALDNANLLSIPEFTNGNVREGVPFGSTASGVADTIRAGLPAGNLVFADGSPRYPTRGGSPQSGMELTGAEVDALLDSALLTAYRARAAIRRPLDTQARVSIWVVDTQGVPLGFTRSQDAPVFGIDVALQKARTAAFFSSSDVIPKLHSAQTRNSVGAFEDYASALQQFVGGFAGTDAFAARSVGNMSRPFFVDGINGNSNGPLSLPFPGSSPAARSWSPFNDGLQLDLIFQRLVAPLGVPSAPRSLPDSCTDASVFGRRLQNGIQIFPGGFPLYRGNTLIGGIGVSGDGIDQDDMISFYGVSPRGLDQAGHSGMGDLNWGFNAPQDMRADQLALPPPDARLRYVNCPEGPFIGSSEQRVCEGL